MSQKIVTTRKLHDCNSPLCEQPILKGEKAKVVTTQTAHREIGTGFYYETYYFHMKCKIILEGEIY